MPVNPQSVAGGSLALQGGDGVNTVFDDAVMLLNIFLCLVQGKSKMWAKAT